LSACGIDDYFFGTAEEPPLPGERLAVILGQQVLTPDADISDMRVVLPRPYQNSEWPQAGGYPTHANYHLGLVPRPTPLWNVSIGEGVQDSLALLAQPVVAVGQVYTMDSDAVVSAFNLQSGQRIWETVLTPDEDYENTIGGGIAYSQGGIFISTGFAEVIALRADNGLEVWRARVPGPMRGAPTVAGGRVMAVTLDNQMVVLNQQDGTRVWSHSGVSETAGILGSASPAADEDITVVPYSSGEIFAMRLDNGRQLWSESVVSLQGTGGTFADIADIRGKPVIDRDLVFVVGSNDSMVALDRNTGARVWDRNIGGTEMPWVAGDFLFVVTSNAEVIALTRRDGRIRWIKQLPRYTDPEDRTGIIKWSGPVLGTDRLLLTGSHGEAWVLSPYDGALQGILELPESVNVQPVIVRGGLLILTDDGDLIAYR